MGKENTCCFTGHRDIPTNQLLVASDKLRTEILQAISDGYTHFICGFAVGTDLIFAEIIAELKQKCSLVLEAAIPYPDRMNTPDEAFQRLIACSLISTPTIILVVAITYKYTKIYLNRLGQPAIIALTYFRP